MKTGAPASASVTRRVRVVPNRNALGLVALLVAMWYAGASQSNGVAYLLGFVLTGVALVSILHTHSNLRGLRIACGPMLPLFAGDRLRVPVLALAAPGATHLAVRIKIRAPGEACAFSEVAGPDWLRADLWMDATQRGCFEQLELRVSSLYPLGFFTACFTVAIHQPRWVYPKAEGPMPLPRTPLAVRNRGAGVRLDGDDFAGLRAYVPGEPQRHIDWKAVARGQELVIKQWAGEADETLRLAWADTAGLEYEARLSQLARWIVLAERQDRSYALTVPGAALAAGHGDAHFHGALRVLAAFPAEEKTP